jgi:hypothetical protein
MFFDAPPERISGRFRRSQDHDCTIEAVEERYSKGVG